MNVFRLKPILVEAVKWTPGEMNDLVFCIGNRYYCRSPFGPLLLHDGDYIVRFSEWCVVPFTVEAFNKICGPVE